MRNFLTLFLLVLKRFFSKRNILLLIVLAVILMYGLHKGSVEYKKSLDDRREFQEIESQSFTSISNYAEYSLRGLNVYFIQPKSGIFFSNLLLFSEMSGKVNSIITLNMNNNSKSRNVLGGNSPLHFRYSSLLLFFGSILALLLGCDCMRFREYLKFLSGCWSSGKVFLSVLFSSGLLMGFVLLVISCLSLVLVALKNIPLSIANLKEILFYLAPAYFMLIFFFMFGTIFGSLRNKYIRTTGILAVWIFFVVIYPMIMVSIIEGKSNDIPSVYRVDTQKLKIVNDFEQQFIEERGSAKNYTLEESRKIVESYFTDLFPEVEAVDDGLMYKIEALVKDYMQVCALLPGTFYTLTCQELSGRGYGSYFSFYRNLKEKRREFLRFWLDRVYYDDPKVMKNFVTGDQNVYQSKSQLPFNYWTGMVITIGEIIILGFISYFIFMRSLYHIPAKELTLLAKDKVELKKGRINPLFIQGNTLNNALFTIFSGKGGLLRKKGFTGQVMVDDVDMVLEKRESGFVYIFGPEGWPGDLLVKDLLNFYSSWVHVPKEKKKEIFTCPFLKPFLKNPMYRLKKHDFFFVMMSLLKITASNLYLINDITPGLPIDFSLELKEKLDALNGKGALTVFLTTVQMLAAPGIIREDSCFAGGDSWLDYLTSQKAALKIKKRNSKN